MTAEASPSRKSWPRWAPFALVFAGSSAALIAWYVLALGDDKIALYRNLNASEAASVTAALDRESIAYSINAAGDVLVARSQEVQARRGLARSHAGPAVVQGFELFDTSDMGLTEFAQKIKYQRALQGELERTIMMMDGVASARVHISEPDRTLFESEPQTAKAAVTLVTRTPEAETPDRIAGIRRLVAAAVTDLSVSDVVVLDSHGDVLSSDVEVLTADPDRRAAAATVTPQLLGGSDQNFIDLVTVVVGRAIPHTRFSIAISTAPTASAAAAANASSAGDSAPRSTIDVTVTTDHALSAADLASVREALAAAGQASSKTVSTMVFEVDAASSTASGASQPLARPTPHRALDSDIILSVLALAACPLAALAVGYWRWRKRARPSLSADEHKSFADALKESLNNAGGQGEPA